MFFKRKKDRSIKNVALFVDGPNIIRKEFNIDLDELRKMTEKYGRIVTGRVFLNQHAPEKLIEAIANQGFEPKVVLAGEVESDVDVSVAVDIVKACFNENIDVIALASRDADYLPALQLAKEMGKIILVIGTKPGFSKALQNIADYVEMLTKRV
ncbi:MAG: TIGR00288 family NYN domain-containing protein [Candidatus Aenigmarchaeota archaeon]|nr:TIGR00288 family NYN domain-containing protein [Candidatus Aenigmarchaeota archaeon]